MPPTGVIYMQVEGGIPPFKFLADFTPAGGSVEHLWHDDTRQASFSTPPTSSESGTLVLRVTDSAATPTVYQNTLTLIVQVAGASPGNPAPTSLAPAEFHPDARPAAQVIGIGSAGDGGQVNCVRAAELPEELLFAARGGIGSNVKNDRVAAALKQAGTLVDDNRWLRFHTGRSSRIRLLLGINALLFKLVAGNPAWVVIRERDAKKALVVETNLMALSPKDGHPAHVLPADWRKAGTPPDTDCASIFFLFNSLKLLSLFVEFKPKPQTTIIEVAVKSPNEFHPSLAVGVIESCPLTERIRFENASQIQTRTIQTLQSYLHGGSPVPFLAGDTL